MTRRIDWYLRRLRQMSAAEIGWRAADRARQLAWSRDQVRPGAAVGLPAGLRDDRQFPTPLPPGTRDQVPAEAGTALLAAADRLRAGDWSLLGTARPDILSPDWFLDPVTGRRAPQDQLAFRIDHRDESLTGNVKSVWELSRHHHLTVLATAWWLTGDDAYAELVDDQLRSWWAANPFLSGVHWTSGIELGVRLTSWAWVRRLLHEWVKVEDLFDSNEDALRQIWWHQRYLAAFRSRGSSANNHVVAEASGRLTAACAFPWYAESGTWRADAAELLERELRANTFDSGVNRELATDYHRFVTELGLVAAAEASAAGHSPTDATWALLTASLDAAAAMLDTKGRAPRQGDGDEGRALVLDEPDADPWGLLLGLGSALVGAQAWWPTAPPSVGATAVAALVPGRVPVPGRPATAPTSFADAGIYLLRTPPEDGPEIWCRCDGGPHGFLSIAAHAHADALSVEVRHDGVDILADPGTYCYHGEPQWRRYFRSTLAHNTIRVDGRDQSVSGGPFLWTSHARARLLRKEVTSDGEQVWTASHDGYGKLPGGPVRHERVVRLRPDRTVAITDLLDARGHHDIELLFHLGPEVTALLDGSVARLTWATGDSAHHAALTLPEELTWTAHPGESDPPLGWYSPTFGQRVPSTTLVGTARVNGTVELRTELRFREAGR